MLPTINQAVLSQVIQALKDGNVRYCEALGFDREELNELNALTVEELMHMGNTSAQFLKITINHDVLRKMLVQVRQSRNFSNWSAGGAAWRLNSVNQPLLRHIDC